MPRLDYSGGASCPALLLEPQRTNSITQSEYFGSSFWTKSGDVTLTSNYGISPEGYQNADRIVANATAGGHIVYRNISTTGTHTISVFAKASGYNHIFFGYDGGNLNFGIVFNLSNGTISQNPAGLTGDIEAIGSDGWYRCNLTFNYSTTNYYFVVSPHDNSSAYSWTGNGTDGILIYGAQIEYNSSYATSYIPTYGSAVTRNDERGTMPSTSYDLSGSFSIFFDLGKTRKVSGGSSTSFYWLNTNQNDFQFYTNAGGGNGINVYLPNQGGYIFNSYGNDGWNADASKICVTYNANTGRLAYFINGTKYNEQTSVLSFTGTDVGSYVEAGSNNLAEIKKYMFFTQALSDEECIDLTTI
jgi:hypothetical protein